MSKHKQKPARASTAERGLNAFHGGRFDEAIALWEPLAATDPRIAAALAEVHLRRALSHRAVPEQQVRDLQRAAGLVPNDAIYQYHLGLAYHRRGDLPAALAAYELAMQGSPRPPGLVFSRALALIESGAPADIGAQPGLSERERTLAAALNAIMRGNAEATPAPSESRWKGLKTLLSGTDPMETLWAGLLALDRGEDAQAHQTLSALSAGLPPKAEALRSYYLGVGAARQGDLTAAQADWEKARTRGLDTPWLSKNLSALHEQQAAAHARAERWAAAAQNARAGLQANPRNVSLLGIAVAALDRLAHEAAARADWAAAAQQWVEAKSLQAQAGGEPPQLLWQNLAIAYEAQEQWEQAGQAWRELLRTKPRSKKAKSEYSEAQWEWIQTRAAEVFKQAEHPAAAIDFLKKAVKSDPGNIAKRLELADALLANDQEIAARNQLQSAQKLDPKHIPTRIKLAELHVQRGEWFSAEQLLRAALEQAPQDPALLQHLTQLLIQRGVDFHEGEDAAGARKAFQEALQYAPDNPDIQINLARVEFDSRHIKAAREHLQQAIALNPRRIETYMQVIGCWAIEGDIKEVRAALAEAEAKAQPDARLYLKAGLDCLSAIPQPEPASFGLFGPLRAPAKNAQRSEWEVLAEEVLDRAFALRPGDQEALRGIVAAAIAASLPRIGLRYAEQLQRLMPEDPMAWVSLGVIQALGEQTKEAKKTLQEAARLARQKGDAQTEQIAIEMRQAAGTPLLAAMLSMASMLDLDDEAFGADDLDDDEVFDEFFRLPPGRRRGRR